MTGPHPLGPRSPSGRRPRTPAWRKPGYGPSRRPRPALFQWLKQIEGTEAALTQKMLDLEKEKVSAEPEEAAGRAQVPLPPPRPGKLGVRFPLLIRTHCSGFCPGAVRVTNHHPSTLLYVSGVSAVRAWFRGSVPKVGRLLPGAAPKPMGPRAHE